MPLKKLNVPDRSKPITLQNFIAESLNCSRNAAKQLIDARRVFVGGKRVWMARHLLKPGDQVQCPVPEKENRQEIRLLVHQAGLLIADKPAGLLSNGKKSLETRLREQLNRPSIEAVHRLDRDTSGCLMLVEDRDLYDRIVEMFRSHQIHKLYRVLVRGTVKEDQFTIRKNLEGKTAESRIRVLARSEDASYLQVELVTGRTHQVRRHMEHIGHPVIGDTHYGAQRLKDARLRQAPRHLLHAWRIALKHPVTGASIQATSPLPNDMKQMMQTLGLT